MPQEGAQKPKRQQEVREQLSRVQQMIQARGQDAASLVRTWMGKEHNKKK